MSTLGNSTLGAGWFSYGINTTNAAWSNYTTPAGGGILISDINAYFDVETAGPATCFVCVWNGGTGALLASKSIASVPNGTNAASGQALHTGTLSSPLYVAGSTSIAIGFWCPQANGFVCTTSNSTSTNTQVGTQAGAGPGTASGATQSANSLVAYVTYTNAGGYVNTGTSGSPVWTAGVIQVNTGTSGSPVWTPAVVYVNTGTPGSPVWTPGA